MTTLPSKAVLIVNPEAGRRRKRRPAEIESVQRQLAAAGISTTMRITTQPGEAETMARRAVESGAEMIIVCGGDGTINEVVCGMAHSLACLAILPGGTANVLARELGLPLDIRIAAQKIVTAAPRRLSLGRAGERYFLLMAGVGFDAGVVRRVNGSTKRLLGMGTYVIEALKFLVAEAPARFTLSTGAGRYDITFACISKSQHYGPIRMVPEADLFSDQFNVYCFRSESRLRYLLYAWAVLTGLAARLPDVERIVTRSVQCEPHHSNRNGIFVQLDGELAGQLPCTIEIVPDALTLLVPDPLADPAPASSRILPNMPGISSTARLHSAAAFACKSENVSGCSKA